MDIKNLDIKIDTVALEPALIISLNIEPYYNIEAPISIAGKLNSSDGRTIAFLNEYTLNTNSHGVRLYSKTEKERIYRENPYNLYCAQLTAVLSQKAIEHIESLREKDSEKAVKFSINLIVKYLILPIEDTDLTKGSLLNVETKRENKDFTIKHSDWINHFSTPLGIGQFLLLELRIPDDKKVSEFWKELYGKLSHNVKDMEKCLKAGDWQKAMLFARKYYENAKIGDDKPGHKEFRDEFDKLLKRDQHCQEGIDNLYDALWKLFEFFSKYIHDNDKKGYLLPMPVSTKEDAYFAYALAIGLLNLIGKKVNED